MTTATVFLTDAASPEDVAFGSLIDLAMVRTGARSAEICDACNTINLGSARVCKGCSHKLPAFYAERSATDTVPLTPRPAPEEKSWTLDLAVLWLVISGVAGATAWAPFA